MLKNIINLTLLFSMLIAICFLTNCGQKSIATSQVELILQPTPPLINANTIVNTDDRKYYSPLDTCQEKKDNSEKNLICD